MTLAQARIQLGGTLIPSWHVYITRPEDDELFQSLLNQEFCNVLTSRQMGKSSLMMATAKRLREAGVQVATLDLGGEIGNADKQELAWRTLIDKIADELDIDDFDPDAWWDAQPEGTNNRKLLRFFRDVVGKAIPGPVVIFFDEIDSTLRLPYSDDFFTALRTIYNERASEEVYARLTFCVVGVATPNELVKDQRTTAYNVGKTIALRDFDEERDDLTQLLRALAADPQDALPVLRRILYWTGGHPYLTLKFCAELAGRSAEDVDDYAQENYNDLGELRRDIHFEQILRFLNERLTEGDAAAAILERIIRGKPEPDRPTLAHAQLKLSGLVKETTRGVLVIRNPIYARLFDQAWLRTLAPKKQQRWLRRYAAAASALAVLLVAWQVYYRFVVLPRNVAEGYQEKLQAATLLRDAREFRAILAGERPDPVTGITLRGHGNDAKVAYGYVRGRSIEKAMEMIRRGEVEQGLLLGAYIAEENGGRIDHRFVEEFTARGYEDLIATLRAPRAFAPGLAVSVDGNDIAVGNVWWRREGSEWLQFPIGTDPGVNAVAFGPDGVYTGDDSGVIRLWTRKGTSRIEASLDRRVLDLIVGPEGELVAIVHGGPGTESSSRVKRNVLVLETGRSPAAVAFANDGKSFVTATGSLLAVWRNGRIVTRFELPDDDATFRDVAVTVDGAVAAAERESVLLLNERLRPAGRIAHAPPVRSIAYSRVRALLATASDEGVRVFDRENRDLALRRGDPVTTNHRNSTAQAVAFDERNRHLVVRRRDAIQIWSLPPGTPGVVADRPLRQWEQKFSLRVTPTEEMVPLVR